MGEALKISIESVRYVPHSDNTYSLIINVENAPVRLANFTYSFCPGGKSEVVIGDISPDNMKQLAEMIMDTANRAKEYESIKVGVS